MDPSFVRTPAGQAEIQARALGLSRALRNLLLVINPNQTGLAWLAQVRGATADDLGRLLAEGLIAPAAAPVAVATVAAPSTPPAAAVDPTRELAAVQQLIDGADYGSLYDVLTAQAKARLGLVKGYRLVLDVEKADGVAGLRSLARQVATQWTTDPGPAALRELHRALQQALASRPPVGT